MFKGLANVWNRFPDDMYVIDMMHLGWKNLFENVSPTSIRTTF